MCIFLKIVMGVCIIFKKERAEVELCTPLLFQEYKGFQKLPHWGQKFKEFYNFPYSVIFFGVTKPT